MLPAGSRAEGRLRVHACVCMHACACRCGHGWACECCSPGAGGARTVAGQWGSPQVAEADHIRVGLLRLLPCPVRAQALPPQLLKQMGGAAGLQSLMKSMEGGKMPGGLGGLMGGLGGGRKG